MVIDSGSDNITLDDDTHVAGDLTLGDKAKDIIIYANRCLWLTAEDITTGTSMYAFCYNQVGEEGFYVWYNGTQTVLGMYAPNGSVYNCWVNNTGGWICE